MRSKIRSLISITRLAGLAVAGAGDVGICHPCRRGVGKTKLRFR